MKYVPQVVPFRAGMHLLETLTSGMYNDPLSIYREYIQNSVDSIDFSKQPLEESQIRIDLNPFDKIVTIYDNGAGIPSDKAELVLSSIGSSDKFGTKQRGFRGIGRLGGIAFAQKVIFKTKAKGESIVSYQEWDCEQLRQILQSANESLLSIEELFLRVTKFSQEVEPDLTAHHFFEVKLIGVESFRNYVFDIRRIKNYLTQVAPLPFDSEHFSYQNEVSSFLKSQNDQYGEYKISINGEQIFRPYIDHLPVSSKQRADRIESVKLFKLKNGKTLLAVGWYANRRDFLGAIRRGDEVSGLRVKVGNIQIGDSHLLDHCFRESRFNSYIVGEIHICSEFLKPNSRRDDFVDNKEKLAFYTQVEKQIGLPLSKEIRLRSRLKVQSRSNNQKSKPEEIRDTEMALFKGNGHQKPKLIPNDALQVLLTQLLEECGDCKTFKNVLGDYLN